MQTAPARLAFGLALLAGLVAASARPPQMPVPPGGAPPPGLRPPGGRTAQPTKPGERRAGEFVLPFSGFDVSKTPPVDPAAIPGLKLKDAGRALFALMQYGPEPTQTLCLIFDGVKPGEARDTLYIYSPGVTNYGTATVIRGQSGRSGKNELSTFKLPPLVATNTELAVKSLSVIETIGGGAEAVRMASEILMLYQGQRYKFEIGGSILRQFNVSDSEKVQAFPLLGSFKLDMRDFFDSTEPRFVAGLACSDIMNVVCNTLKADLDVLLEDAEGKKIMKETVTAKPRDALKTGGAHDFAVDLKRVKEGEKYTLTVTLDAGALGLFEETKTFTAPGKSKEKDREKKPDKK